MWTLLHYNLVGSPVPTPYSSASRQHWAQQSVPGSPRGRSCCVCGLLWVMCASWTVDMLFENPNAKLYPAFNIPPPVRLRYAHVQPLTIPRSIQPLRQPACLGFFEKRTPPNLFCKPVHIYPGHCRYCRYTYTRLSRQGVARDDSDIILTHNKVLQKQWTEMSVSLSILYVWESWCYKMWQWR